ncbi:hypothetical protein CP969_12105 [Streptomyces viridosporus T7A]|uniref:Uncharacterized protein n=1 Tax=Streptomyces viridosporus T7A TaxID=665577 RepID=A0ABX6AC94_STRVD|nr:hypothetical protein CP969_12105 [Streptomyces viridosporus T7A]
MLLRERLLRPDRGPHERGGEGVRGAGGQGGGAGGRRLGRGGGGGGGGGEGRRGGGDRWRRGPLPAAVPVRVQHRADRDRPEQCDRRRAAGRGPRSAAVMIVEGHGGGG